MKNQLLFTLISIITFNSFSQIKFEKGYFIGNSGVKTECLIKNFDWYNNPSELEYKLNESSTIEKESINTIKEFAVNDTKYTRFLVDLDRSSNQINSLSQIRKPIFNKETLFLKSLIEGNANLYLYTDGNLIRFFYNVSNKEVTPLIFKEYKIESNIIKENNHFKHQLLTDLKCSSISIKVIENIKYKKNDLIDFFIRYNKCINSDFTEYDIKNEDDLFNLNVRLGVNSSSLSISNDYHNVVSMDYDNKLNFRFGIETEFILPFNKNKWAVLIEPTFQYYKIKKETDVVDYKSIELPVGLRYYFFLNETNKLFVNSLIIYDLPLKSTIRHLDIGAIFNLALGVGYNYKGKYSLELRYLTNRHVLNEHMSWHSKYKTLSFIFGYNIF